MKLIEHESLKNENVILLGQVGSKAYGTDTPTSDDDFMGVALAPMSCYAGLDTWKNGGTVEIKRSDGEEVDAVVYELKKFFKLCLDFNPNVIPLLYLRQQDYKSFTGAGSYILNNRKMFESQKAYHTFLGYAKHQLDNVRKGVTGKYGEKRKALILEYGYDIKFAYHTVRLLEMISEFFLTREMNVHRGDQVFRLMQIRRGEWSEKQFFEYATMLLEMVEASFEKSKSWLPEKPDYDKANQVCMDLVTGRYF